jgi:hypothetical protein
MVVTTYRFYWVRCRIDAGPAPPAGRDQQPADSGWPALALASSAGNWSCAWAMATASWYSRHPVICASRTRSTQTH